MNKRIDFIAKEMSEGENMVKTSPHLSHIEYWEDCNPISMIEEVSRGYYVCTSKRHKPMIFLFDEESISEVDYYDLDKYLKAGSAQEFLPHRFHEDGANWLRENVEGKELPDMALKIIYENDAIECATKLSLLLGIDMGYEVSRWGYTASPAFEHYSAMIKVARDTVKEKRLWD